MTSKKQLSVQQKDKVGLQELEENFSIGDQEEASLYDNSLLDKQVDNLDDSLCMDEGTNEEDTLVPSMETSTTGSQHSENARSQEPSVNVGVKNCSLVDELFDDHPVTSQSTNDSVEAENEQPEKKIAPSFRNENKKKRFRAPVQSATNNTNTKGAPKDNPKNKPQQASINPESKVEKAKPVFSTKLSTGRKRKSPETVSNDDKITEPPKKVSKTDADKQKPDQCSLASEVNTETIEKSNNDNTSGDATVEPTISIDTLKETSGANDAAKEKKKPKEGGKTKHGSSVKKKEKAVDKIASKKLAGEGEDKSSTGSSVGESMNTETGKNLDGRSEVKFKKKKQKIVQQQHTKIDISCKNLEKEQRKAEKELKKIDRELKKARNQSTHKAVKKSTETQVQSSSSGDRSGEVWVQCDHPSCLKWRRLNDCNSPCEIPDEWYCNMNPDKQYSSCLAPEEDSATLSDSQEFVYSSYAPGTLVWAKVTGYPWWPAMIQDDCNKDTFYEKHPSCHTPIAYHVVFFGKPISRAWVHSLCLQLYLPDENPNMKVAQKYNKSLKEAVNEADEAGELSVEERLVKYSFEKLYSGKPFDYNQWTGDDDVTIKKRKRGAPRKPRRRLNGNSQ